MNDIEQAVNNMDVGDLQAVLLGETQMEESGAGVSDPLQAAVDGMSTKDLSMVLLGEKQAELVEEGGNRFPNVTRINQENAGPTMEELKGKLKSFFGLTDEEIVFTGSTGKKKPGGSSGDMDCAISLKAIKDKFGIETPEEWYDICGDFAKENGLDIDIKPEFKMEGVAMAYPIVNNDGKQEGEFVQLDLVPVENLKLRAFSQYSPQEVEGEPYVKGLVRCQIMMAIARFSGFKVLEMGKVNKREDERPVKWERYSYGYQTGGLYKNTYERPLMPGKRGEEGIHKATEDCIGKELVSDDPDEICEILFGVDSANMLTWEDAWKAAKKVGIFDDDYKRESFRKILKKELETSIKKGNLPYLPPEIAQFLDIDVEGLFGTKKKQWDMAAE